MATRPPVEILPVPTVDLNRATSLTPEVLEAIVALFTSHQWTFEQQAHGTVLREALDSALRVIVAHVPPSPDRSSAIRKLREAGWACDSAITFEGRY